MYTFQDAAGLEGSNWIRTCGWWRLAGLSWALQHWPVLQVQCPYPGVMVKSSEKTGETKVEWSPREIPKGVAGCKMWSWRMGFTFHLPPFLLLVGRKRNTLTSTAFYSSLSLNVSSRRLVRESPGKVPWGQRAQDSGRQLLSPCYIWWWYCMFRVCIWVRGGKVPSQIGWRNRWEW